MRDFIKHGIDVEGVMASSSVQSHRKREAYTRPKEPVIGYPLLEQNRWVILFVWHYQNSSPLPKMDRECLF